jgi:site-specific DNA recombinase
MSFGNTLPEVASPLRVAVYSRFSSNMQRPASLEDQERNCRKYAEERGWEVLDQYVRGDSAMSGKKLAGRTGLNSLIADAQLKPRPFDVLILDESSRMARNLPDILQSVNLLKYVGVKVVFVAQKLDSDDPSFSTLLTFHGMMDEQNSERMRHRVLRGQEGRARQGFTTGSRCFGYRSMLVPNPDKPEAQGRADMLGTKWVIVESEAATIRRIYSMYADGLSDYQICLKLNEEKVPAARKPRIGSADTTWNCTLIKNILNREKYIGKSTWNKTKQVTHPVTGKIETRKNPPELWITNEVPELRIVSDELWNRVQDRLKIVNERMTRRRIAGCNRAKARPYLFSGLLVCGVCGSSITIGSSHKGGRNAAYRCVSSRLNRGCTNKLWIREDRLTGQFVQALKNNLLVPEVMEYFVGSVSEELEHYLKGASSNREDSLENLRAREASLKSAISRLLAAIMNPSSAGSTALPELLSQTEADLRQVQSDLNLLSVPKNLSEAHLDLAAVVRANVSELLEVIMQDVLKSRQVLQRHITRLTLVPRATANGPAYEVFGEIDLFVPQKGRKECILLAHSSTGTVQQYTRHVDFLFRFAGLVVYSQVDLGPHPLLGPLAELLGAESDLLHQPKTAKEWAALIRSVVPHEAELYERLNVVYVGWSFRNRAEPFVQHLGMVEITHGRAFYYMFSKAGVTPPIDTGGGDLATMAA